MTIVESICEVLKNSNTGMTSKEIYEEIVKTNLYIFGAKKPENVVNGEIRRRCYDLDFPTAYPVKLFGISGYKGKKPLFVLAKDFSQDKKKSSLVSKAETDILPEEKIGVALEEHLSVIRQQLLERIMNNSPSFFEQLVVDLLLKMGYGYDQNSGIVVGKSHDGGIDGVINEDKLGLDLIYLQAKRYNEKNTVGRKEIQAFIGAMENVQKGVFITTSKFTKEAITFANRQQKNIKLIDGELLVKLMVKYEVGITSVQTLTLYKIDYDYFN